MSFIETKILTYNGLSTDIKPTNGAEDDVLNGSRFREVDTERTYYYNLADDTWWIDGPQLDPMTHAEIVIDQAHHEIHEGDHYFVKTYISNAVGAATDYFAFTTPNTATRIHAKSVLAPDVDYVLNIYEGATITGGTPVAGINNDRDSTNVAELITVGAPTVNTPGTLIWSARTGGGKDPVGIAPGLNYEIIAKTNSVYVFELIKQAISTVSVVDLNFWWYEHAPLI